MSSLLSPDHLGRVDRLTEAERRELAHAASGLRHAALAGGAHRPLLGKNIGLVCEDPDGPDAARFEEAARAIGARVVHIRPSVAGLNDDVSLPQTARMLGRLYDALECQDMPAERVEQIRHHAAVPVYDALARIDPAGSAIGAWLNGDGSDPQISRYLIQAMLVGSLA